MVADQKSGTTGGVRILLGAKIHPPLPPPGSVPRPHLIEMLERTHDVRFTLISAPAGYGKSTLVSQWLESAPSTPVAWLSLDRLDNDLERFVRYVISALRRVDEACLPGTEEMLPSPDLPSVHALAESMLSEIERLEQRMVLVIDDYGFIRAEAIHELLRLLISDLPATLRLVMTSRLDPPLPLSEWRSRHWLHELRASDLSFSRDETGAFFAAANEVRLSDEGVDAIHRKTEGWITGLRLAQLSLTGEAEPEERVRAFSASNRLVADYLVEQTLARQPAEIREFLAITSVLGRFSPQLCDELLPGSDSGSAGRGRELLDRLFRKNLFLVPLGPTSDWYRYNDLFRELLLERFDELTPGASKPDILKRAGDWFCDQRWTEDGLRCYLAAGDLDAAEEVIATHLREVITNDMSRRTLTRWLEMFPSGAERTRVPLLVASCYMCTLRADIEGLAGLLEEIDEMFSAAGGDRHRRWRSVFRQDLEFLRMFASFWKGDVEGACVHGSRALDQPSSTQDFTVAMASGYYALSLALTGRWSEHLRLVERGTTGPGISDSPQQLPFLGAKALALFFRGELAQCRAAATTLAIGQDFAVPKFYEAIGYLLLGFVAYESNELDEAERSFLAVESRRYDTAGMVRLGAAMGLAQIQLARGDYGAAERNTALVHAVALESRSPTLTRNSEMFERYIAAAADKPVDFANSPPTDPDCMHFSILPPSHCWSWVQVRGPSAETRRAALDVIDLALQRAEDHEATGRVIQLSALRALALEALDRRDEAITNLEEALRRGADLGFVRSFVDCGEGIRPLLEAIAERSPDDEYAAMLLEALTGSAPSTSGADRARVRSAPGRRHGAPVEGLTNRELDVLELLQQRLTNKEIAARLGISSGTVKMHTRGIYRKLGVRGRRQAVVKAVELGVLAG